VHPRHWEYQAALPYIARGEAAPARPGREVADRGRMGQLAELRRQVEAELGS
jgi:hypothetical protein